MTSAPLDVADGSRQRRQARATPWLMTGRLATAAAVAVCLLMQATSHDWFPPDISVSQYGLGPRGWLFTCWTVLLVVAALALARSGAASGVRQPRSVYGWLAVGCVGLLVMGIVRTDAGGAQHSWHARTHQVASVLALLALPVGIVLAMARAGRRWRRAALVLCGCSALALLLVLLSAFGVPTPALDVQHSWALWQAVAVTVDLMLVGVFALAGTTGAEQPRAFGRPQ